MKKILLFLGILWMCGVHSTFAALECVIKDRTAPPLEQYISNLNELSSNFSAQLGKYSTKAEDVFMVQKRRIQHLYNAIINWTSYISTASFFIKYGMSNAYATPIWRDYSLLEREEQEINTLIKKMINSGYPPHQIDIEKLCHGLTRKHCAFSGKTTGKIDVYDALGEILKNHQQIMHMYRLNISWDAESGEKIREIPNFLFVNVYPKKGFAAVMREYYNASTTEACGKDEKEQMGYFEKIKDNISNFHERYAQGMDAWKNAIAKINDIIEGKQDNEAERVLLEQELASQGLSTKQSEVILNNLDRFNQEGGWSRDNNFITNSYQYLQNSVTTQIDAFDEAIREITKRDGDSAPMVEVSDLTHAKATESEITARSRRLFEENQISALFQDNTSMNLEGEFIDVYADINQSINNLTNIKKVAQKICNDQGNGLGTCDTK